MAAASFMRSIFLNHFVKPRTERPIFRSVSRVRPQKIVEVGLDCAERGADLIELAQRHRPTIEIRYTGLDLFDVRTGDQSLTLKTAHSILKPTGATIQLIPGDPFQCLESVANHLASTDLLVISSSHGSASEQPNWYYIPRMLHDHSVVYWQTMPDQPYRRLGIADIQQLMMEQNSAADSAPIREAA